MKSPLRYHTPYVILVITLTLVFSCHRAKYVPPPLPEAVRPPLVCPPRPDAVCPPLVLLSPEQHPFFQDDGNRDELKQALKNQLLYFYRLKQPVYYSWGNETVSSETLKNTLKKFLEILDNDDERDLNTLMKAHFDLYQSSGERGTGAVTFTGYYLPRIEARLTANKTYRYPLYRLPDDLIMKELNLRGIKKAVRIEGNKEYPYYTREQIDQKGVLKGKGYEIAYLKDPIDCYLLHVQGSGTLTLPDGAVLYLQFAGSNYLPYTSLREEMLKDGVISADNSSMDAIRIYFSEHPEQLHSYLNRNKRYTFFRVRKGAAVGSLGVELTAGRSIATDKQIFPSGALSYVMTAVPSANSSGDIEKTIPWSRFVLNQDEGGAIKGPHRVDIFWGSGAQAELIASHMNYPGKLYYLKLKGSTN